MSADRSERLRALRDPAPFTRGDDGVFDNGAGVRIRIAARFEIEIVTLDVTVILDAEPMRSPTGKPGRLIGRSLRTPDGAVTTPMIDDAEEGAIIDAVSRAFTDNGIHVVVQN